MYIIWESEGAKKVSFWNFISHTKPGNYSHSFFFWLNCRDHITVFSSIWHLGHSWKFWRVIGVQITLLISWSNFGLLGIVIIVGAFLRQRCFSDWSLFLSVNILDGMLEAVRAFRFACLRMPWEGAFAPIQEGNG